MAQNRDIYIALGVGALFFLMSQKSASAQTTAGTSDSTTEGLLGILSNLTKPKPGTPTSASKPSSGSGGSGGGNGASAAANALKAAQAKAQAMLAAIGKAAANGFNSPLGTTDDSGSYNNDYLGFGDPGTYSAPDLSDRLGNGVDDGSSISVSQTDNGYGDFLSGIGGGSDKDEYGYEYVPTDYAGGWDGTDFYDM